MASIDALVYASANSRGHARFHQPRRLFHPRVGNPRRPRQCGQLTQYSRRLQYIWTKKKRLRARRVDFRRNERNRFTSNQNSATTIKNDRKETKGGLKRSSVRRVPAKKGATTIGS